MLRLRALEVREEEPTKQVSLQNLAQPHRPWGWGGGEVGPLPPPQEALRPTWPVRKLQNPAGAYLETRLTVSASSSGKGDVTTCQGSTLPRTLAAGPCFKWEWLPACPLPCPSLEA